MHYIILIIIMSFNRISRFGDEKRNVQGFVSVYVSGWVGGCGCVRACSGDGEMGRERGNSKG